MRSPSSACVSPAPERSLIKLLAKMAFSSSIGSSIQYTGARRVPAGHFLFERGPGFFAHDAVRVEAVRRLKGCDRGLRAGAEHAVTNPMGIGLSS